MTNSFPPGSTGVPESSMPTGAPGLMPRRSSYASVVSGVAPATSPTYQHISRSGAFTYLLNQTHDSGYDSTLHNWGLGRYDSRSVDMDQRSYLGNSGSWSRSGQLPSFSSAFGSMNGFGYDGYGGGQNNDFFVPSYLKGSTYVQKLEETYKTKMAVRRDAPSAHSSQPGSLSTSNSSVNLHAKMAPSHRGMTYDLIEKAPPLEDESLSPLPSRWNTNDKHAGLEILGDGLEVKFTGRTPSERDHEASSVRADHFMPSQCGIYYFEVTVLSRKREESSIGIGFSSKDVPLSRTPGWEPESWAYHGDDGNSFCCLNSGKHYGPPFTTNDVVGCGINFNTGCAFFTKNGDNLGTAFREIKGKLFPSVGMKRPGEHVRVNFGQSPFVFDIDDMMLEPVDDPQQSQNANHLTSASPRASVSPRAPFKPRSSHTYPVSPRVPLLLMAYFRGQSEKRKAKTQVQKTSTEKLAPPLDETSLIQALVLQFLSHDGYVETANAFAKEVHAERQALNIDSTATLKPFDFIKEDEDAVNRQRIRTAILDGDVDKALKHTNAYYPNVLKDNEHIYFQLRSRKFIEMIRRAAEIRAGSINAKKTNGDGGDWYEDVINHDMELDEPHVSSNGWDKMDTDAANDSQADYTKMLEDTINYGKILQAEFRDDPRREIKKALEDAFALLAYEDPMNAKEVSHLLRREGRVAVAEELNSAILVSLGKSSCAALECLIQQTTVLIDDLREGGGLGAFVNVDDYMKLSPNN